MQSTAQTPSRAFRDWPLKRKLLAITMVTTSLALALGATGIVLSDSVLFRQYVEHDLSALSRIIADNSTGALAFDDPEVAADTLGALRARTHLIGACIYRMDGSVLARYVRPVSTTPCPPPLEPRTIRFSAGEVSVSQPIVLAQRRIGTLTLSYDLAEISERRKLYGGLVFGILLLSTIVAALLSSRLRDVITIPISTLVETATAVSKSSNYDIRAQKLSGDEMGALVDAFNEMLNRIALRDEELRQALTEREQANRQLARSNEDLERFAFVASHDLQEPLRMITLYLQLLERRALLDASPETSEFVAIIMQGARRMSELLSDLRAYAELGTDIDQTTEVDLNIVVGKAKDNLRLALESSEALVTSDRLPSMRAYEGHLIPLFQNLIANAVKYRRNQAPRIHVSFRREGDVLEFGVSDNGIGIAPEYHAKIFAPFKRLHGSDVPGSGIGLAICQRVVERYGGRIWVESVLGEGSTFRFTLPQDVLATKAKEEILQ